MAAVAARSSHNSPHLNSRMSSPKDPKRHVPLRNEDAKQQSSLLNSQEARESSPVQTDGQNGAAEVKIEGDSNATGNNAPATTNAQVFAPPPRPTQNNVQEGQDYFSSSHGTQYGIEPNPFENSFAQPSSETPGKSLLPPVASLTSPSSLLPGGTPGWGTNSLRTGPLSPAMLSGPAGGTDYFSDPHFRGSFPTPNESSLRTGLTPGGGGSMFPAPSPNSQALFASLQSGGATPSTIDFRQTAMHAAAQAKANNFAITSNPKSQPQESKIAQNMDQKQFHTSGSHPQGQQDPFGQHDTDAANGLYLLAQNGGRNTNQFAMPNQPSHVQTNMQQMNNHAGGQSQDTSPMTHRAPKNSIGSMSGSMGTGEFSDSGRSEQAKPATRSRGKKGSNIKSNGKRKAEDTPAKAPASRRPKANSTASLPLDMDLDSDEDGSPKQEELGENGKKMTDEEKRKNFLERNRVAALKCRQRKKQWLANLQTKVEIFSTENDALSAQVTQLREEIVNLKTLLMAHKECPVGQQQGLQNLQNYMQDSGAFQGHHVNPYGMGMPGPNGAPQMSMGMPPQGGPQSQMQRSLATTAQYSTDNEFEIALRGMSNTMEIFVPLLRVPGSSYATPFASPGGLAEPIYSAPSSTAVEATAATSPSRPPVFNHFFTSLGGLSNGFDESPTRHSANHLDRARSPGMTLGVPRRTSSLDTPSQPRQGFPVTLPAMDEQLFGHNVSMAPPSDHPSLLTKQTNGEDSPSKAWNQSPSNVRSDGVTPLDLNGSAHAFKDILLATNST